MFSIESDFTLADLEAIVKGEVDAWIMELAEYFKVRGRELVDKARAKTKSDGGFGNITWNLRGSIGMCVVLNGKIIDTYFPPITKGEHGTTLGREMAERLAVYGKESDGVNMVFVAAESYASIVQTTERDVINHVIGDNLEEALKGIL